MLAMDKLQDPENSWHDLASGRVERTMTSSTSEGCTHDVPLALERCPLCGRAGTVPNVKAAQVDTERRALEQRYQTALQEAAGRDCHEIVASFEATVRNTHAVLNRTLLEVEYMASSDRHLYASYYQCVEAGAQMPYGDRWDRLRQLADAALFPLYAREIRFAALSLDGIGVLRFGECSLTLREDLIAHRASVFEDNSAVFLRDRRYEVPPGYRATWAERSKLCVAKLADRLLKGTAPADFPKLLLEQGETPEDDRFVEVHIWGPLSILAFVRAVLFCGGQRQRSQGLRKALRARLASLGLDVEVR